MDCIDDELIDRLAIDAIDPVERVHYWNHVEGCENCSARLQEAIAALDEDDDTVDPAATAGGLREDVRGQILGRYVVIDQIGEGGLGEVYSAYDPELDRRVAIKLLQRQGGSEQEEELTRLRLKREARALARVNHPNAIAIYDVGQAKDRLYLAMELVKGRPLRRWVRETQPSASEIVDVVVQAAGAVSAAHHAGVVHRDLKPGNILVSEDGTPKVLDFGLARGIVDEDEEVEEDELGLQELSQPGDLGEALTGAGSIAGTPGYMAPEQYDPEAKLGPAVDQFGLSVLTWECLFRQRPFRGDTAAERKKATLALDISQREGISVPEQVLAVLRRGMAIHPDDRWPSVEAWADALRPKAEALPSRAPNKLWLAAALAAAVAAGGLGVQLLTRADDASRSEVDALVTQARDAAARQRFVYPSAEDPDAATAYTTVLKLDGLEGGAAQLGDEASGQLRQDFAGALRSLGDRYWDLEGGRGFALDYYAQALIFDPEDARARERSGLTFGALASLQAKAERGEFTRGELLAAAPLAALAEEDEAERADKLAVALSEATASSTQANLEELLGETAFKKVRKRAKAGKVKPTQKSEEPKSAEPVADSDEEPPADSVELAAPDLATAPAEAEEPSADSEAGQDKADVSARADAHVARGRQLLRQAKFDKAETEFNQALALDRRHKYALRGLAEAHFERGRYREALRYGQEAARRLRKDAELALLVGDAQYKLHAYPEAKAEYERAKSLGHASADKRLRRLQAKLGG